MVSCFSITQNLREVERLTSHLSSLSVFRNSLSLIGGR
jgi:hypothetical protein